MTVEKLHTSLSRSNLQEEILIRKGSFRTYPKSVSTQRDILFYIDLLQNILDKILELIDIQKLVLYMQLLTELIKFFRNFVWIFDIAKKLY